MIKNINQGGRYINVYSSSSSTYVNSYGGAQGVGNMRYNTSMQCIEVFDGNTWIKLNMSDATVSLNQEAESILDYAREKRNEELMLKERMERYPGLREAYERLEIMKALTLEEDKKDD